MFKQILRLTRLLTLNLFGINEFRHTKDSTKRKRYLILASIWVLVAIMIISYSGSMSYGLIKIGLGNIIPLYIYTVVSILIFMFTMFKASSILFSMKTYAFLISLPVSKSSIIISRFLSMYVTNLLMALLVTIPSITVYGFLENPKPSFYLIFFIGMIIAPLLPLTIASIIGAVITAISVRVKHKSIVQTVLMCILFIILMAGSMLISNSNNSLNDELFKNMAQVMERQIGKFYPPALWFNNAVYGAWSYLLDIIVLPIMIFILFVAILQKHFQSICMKINTFKTKNDYRIENLNSSSILITLLKKELKRYFASSIYVTNTIVGYILAVLATVSFFIVGFDKLCSLIGISNYSAMVRSALPFFVALLMSITSMTSSSISMEGKTLWQIQTLPVRRADIYISKIMANLAVALPFYVISTIFACLSVEYNPVEYIYIILIPAVYILFIAVVGITINLLFPVLNWDNEVRVVKQSASTFICMIIGALSALIPIAFIILLGESAVNQIRLLTLIVISSATFIIYKTLTLKIN